MWWCLNNDEVWDENSAWNLPANEVTQLAA
jgi:hypothetical protein